MNNSRRAALDDSLFPERCCAWGLGAARLAQITRSMVLRGIWAVVSLVLLVVGCAGAIRLIGE